MRLPVRHDTAAEGERGFTILEVVIAVTIVAGAFTALAHASFGSMAVLHASRSRSVFVELANAEVESLRALQFEAIGVSSTDPDRAASYPGGQHEGQDAVVLDVAALRAADPAFPDPPLAVEESTAQAADGVRGYTIHRWVTWSDDTGAAGGANVKRIEVVLEWDEGGRATRSVTLHSLVYPGGLGPLGPDSPPVAQAGASVTSGHVPLLVSFDSTGSADPEGVIDSYEWDFGDGTTATGATTSHTYATPGHYTAVLTVTDGSGQVAARSIDIDAVDPSAGLPPAASFTAAPTNGTAPLSVTFDGSGSSDPEGGVLTYLWEWGDGTPNGTGVGATHTYTGAGSFTARLTVTDPTGRTGSATVPVQTVPLTCAITSASFRNPSGNAVSNDIKVGSNNRASSSSFSFTATTNVACASLSASLPLASGSFVQALGYSDAGGVRTWSGTGTTTAKWNRAMAQTGFFTAGAGVSFPIAFNVHT